MSKTENVYNNFPSKSVSDKVLKEWKEYKETYGLECDLYYDGHGKRKPITEVERDIKELRKLRGELESAKSSLG
jgi:hypothetical protein